MTNAHGSLCVPDQRSRLRRHHHSETHQIRWQGCHMPHRKATRLGAKVVWQSEVVRAGRRGALLKGANLGHPICTCRLPVDALRWWRPGQSRRIAETTRQVRKEGVVVQSFRAGPQRQQRGLERGIVRHVVGVDRNEAIDGVCNASCASGHSMGVHRHRHLGTCVPSGFSYVFVRHKWLLGQTAFHKRTRRRLPERRERLGGASTEGVCRVPGRAIRRRLLRQSASQASCQRETRLPTDGRG